MPFDAGDDAGKESTQFLSMMAREFVARSVFPKIGNRLRSQEAQQAEEGGRARFSANPGPGYDLMVMTYSFDSEERRDAFVEHLEEKGLLVQPNRNPANGQYVATVAFDPLANEVSIINSTLASIQRDGPEISERETDEAEAPLLEEGYGEGRDRSYDLSVDEELEDAAAALAQEESETSIGEIVADIAEQVR